MFNGSFIIFFVAMIKPSGLFKSKNVPLFTIHYLEFSSDKKKKGHLSVQF